MANVTIEDICVRARASRTAVSRVLNNRPGVTPEKRERILKVIRQLKYTPSAAARNLRKSKTDTLGIIVPKFEGAVFSRFLDGVEEAAQSHGYYILTLTTTAARLPMEAQLEASMRLIDERRVDGLVIFDPARHLRGSEKPRKMPIPFVLAYQRPEEKGVHSVVNDDFRGAYDATCHLIEHGYERIATLTGPMVAADARERLRGFEEALRNHSRLVPREWIVEGTFDRSPSVADFVARFEGVDWPEAVFVANDDMALGLLQWTRAHADERIRATAIVGFDDGELAAYAGLTTVHVDVREIGRRSARHLIGLIEQRNDIPLEEVVVPELVVRWSCGCLSSRKKLSFPA